MGKFSKFLMAVVVLGTIGMWVYMYMDRMPDDVVARAKAIPGKIAEAQKEVESQKALFHGFRNSGEFAHYRQTASEDRWEASITEAETTLSKLTATYDKEVEPMMGKRRGKTGQTAKLFGYRVQRYEGEIRQAVEGAKRWSNRRAAFDTAEKNHDTWRADLDQRVAELSSKLIGYEGELRSYLVKFPDERSKFSEAFTLTRAEIEIINHELDGFKRAANERKFLVVYDAYHAALTRCDKLKSEFPNLSEVMGTLAWANSQVVGDLIAWMKVVLHRETWDPDAEGSDAIKMYVDVSFAEFARLAKFFDTFTKENNRAQIARLGNNKQFEAPDGDSKWVWDLIHDRIKDQVNVNINTWHSAGGLWLDTLAIQSPKVRFVQIQPGKIEYTDWSKDELSEGEFWLYAKNFAMEADRKMVGELTMQECPFTPFGFSLIATQDGQWIGDGSGGQYWEFAGRLAALNDWFDPGDRITRAEYDAWRQVKESKDFYGSKGQYGLFGYATQRAPALKNTEFAKLGGFDPEFVQMVRQMWAEAEKQQQQPQN